MLVQRRMKIIQAYVDKIISNDYDKEGNIMFSMKEIKDMYTDIWCGDLANRLYPNAKWDEDRSSIHGAGRLAHDLRFLAHTCAKDKNEFAAMEAEADLVDTLCMFSRLYNKNIKREMDELHKYSEELEKMCANSPNSQAK